MNENHRMASSKGCTVLLFIGSKRMVNEYLIFKRDNEEMQLQL